MVQLNYGGNLLEVCPWVPALAPHLTFERRRFNPEKQRNEAETETWYHLEGGCGYVTDGFGDRVERLLTGMGMEYTVRDERRWAEMPPVHWDGVDLPSLRPGQDDMLVSVASHHSGVYDAPTGFGKTHVIRMICRMYPHLTIAVATPRKHVVAEIHKRLSTDPMLCQRVHKSLDGTEHFPGKISVSTTKSLLRCHPEKCDLLIVDECHCMGAERITMDAASFPYARRFGFSASPTGRSDGADLVQEALLGPLRMQIPYQDSVNHGSVVQIKVRVRRVECEVPDRFTSVSKKRVGLWRNTVRNKIIAEEAKTLVGQGLQTLIMCETVEHLMELSKLLPGWPLVHGPLSADEHEAYVAEGLLTGPRQSQKDMDKLANKFASGEVMNVLSTFVWKEGVDFKRLSALIRADGQSGNIASTQIPGRLSRLFAGKDHGLLVDFIDDFHPQFKAGSWKRISTYKSKGWEITYV